MVSELFASYYSTKTFAASWPNSCGTLKPLMVLDCITSTIAEKEDNFVRRSFCLVKPKQQYGPNFVYPAIRKFTDI